MKILPIKQVEIANILSTWRGDIEKASLADNIVDTSVFLIAINKLWTENHVYFINLVDEQDLHAIL